MSSALSEDGGKFSTQVLGGFGTSLMGDNNDI
jgi:hypothetical protein